MAGLAKASPQRAGGRPLAGVCLLALVALAIGAPCQGIAPARAAIAGARAEPGLLVAGPFEAGVRPGTARLLSVVLTALPPECEQAGPTVTCTYASGSGIEFTVPADVSSVHVLAIGGTGAAGVGKSPGATGGPGGHGARVSGDLAVGEGSKLWVFVGGNGGQANGGGPGQNYQSNVSSGAGGGASEVRTSRTEVSSRLLVAGGGGGGGNPGDKTPEEPGVAGGAGGDAGMSGSAGTAFQAFPAGTAQPGQGGGGGSGEVEGAGGTGGASAAPYTDPGCTGTDSIALGTKYRGGSGGSGGTCYAGGGGGGAGVAGGGGGGGGGAANTPEDLEGQHQVEAGAGGGGGGSNLVPAGGEAVLDMTGEPRVVISYLVPGSAAPPSVTITTPPEGASYTVGQVVDASFSCAEGAGGPGLVGGSEGCAGTVANGAPIDTSTPGPHSFTVMSTSQDTEHTSVTHKYTVKSEEGPTSTLSITVIGEGTGSVSDNFGHTCSKTTSAMVSCPVTSWAHGTVVTLQGAPTGNSSFDGFLGPGCSLTPTCSVTMNANQTVTALVHAPQEVGITLAGTGYGSVTATPLSGAKFSCSKPPGSSGAFCPHYLKWGTLMNLQATPEAGSEFTGWEGGCKGTGECVLDTAFGAQFATARFSPGEGVHVNAIEVTQGIQTPELPTRTSSAGFHVSYKGVAMPWSAGAPVTVKLVEGHATVARVYINTSVPLASLPPMRLSAIHNGVTLAPGPIGPDQPSPAAGLPFGALGVVSATQRFNPAGAYTFTLPPAWTHGEISLQADTNPDPNAFADGCSDVVCRDRGLILDGVDFHAVRTTQIDPIAFVAGLYGPKGYPGYDPQWSKVQAVMPVPLQVVPYVQTTSALGTLAGCAGLEQGKEKGKEESNAEFEGKVYRKRSALLLQSVNEWELVHANVGYPFGIASSEVPNTCPNAGGFGGGLTGGGGSMATDNRPITAMAHEFSHAIGRTHAGVECGSGTDAEADKASSNEADQLDDALNGYQRGEVWPQLVGGTNFVGGTVQNTFPASTKVESDGALDGVGLVGLDNLASSPYQITYNPTLPNPAGEVYDLMSYCGGAHWMSVRNWNRDVEYAEGQPVDFTGPVGLAGVRGSAAASPAADDEGAPAVFRRHPAASARSARTLAVSIVYDTGTDRPLVMNAAPDEGEPTPGEPGGYSLTARDASGHVLAGAGAFGASVHIDGGAPLLLVLGRIPAAGVRTVEVLQDGQPIAVDRASPAAPTASLVSPRRGARLGGPRGAVIRWRSHDTDGDTLTATIRYSPDGGRTWRTVFSGADQGSAVLPSYLLGASRRARIRLYVSDGFDEAIVTSPTFVAIGAPPQVTITSPGRGLRESAGAALALTGSAFDDAGAPLSGRALTWRSGRQILGTGGRAVTVALPAGRHVITLTARDRQGRSSSASVAVTIIPSMPIVRLLSVPHRVSSKATALTIRIATLAPATLTVAGRRTSLTRNQRSVRVPIRPGRKPLTIVLVLRSGSFTSRLTAAVAR